MAIVGAHVLVYSPEAEAVRDALRDLLGWEHVEANPGWLIFKLPPAELGIHPTEGPVKHELCLMCDNLEATIAELRAKGIEFRGEPRAGRFGTTTTMLLPGGVDILLYEPTHASPLDL